MIRQQQRIIPSHAKSGATIRWRGKLHAIQEAGALAARELSLGNFQAAVEIYDLILTKVPDAAMLHNNRGVALQKLKRYNDALAGFGKAIALKPDFAEAHNNRGAVLQELNRLEEALASYDQAIALKQDYANAHFNRGTTLKKMNRYKDAVASFDKAVALQPGYAEAYNNRGLALLTLGDIPAAEEMFLKAFALKPVLPDPLFNLANIRTYQNVDNAEVKNIHALLQRPSVPAHVKEHLYFCLGKIHDDCGLYDEAFEWFRLANQIRNSKVAYDSGGAVSLTDNLIEVFSKDFLAQPFSFASDSQSPLFIVGMPRSGTTLMASILSNHPAIATAGELLTIPNFASRLPELTGTSVPYPQAVKQITPALAARLINEYEERLRRGVDPQIPLVIDKNPLNFRHLGFISMLFPKARIIHCTRHPLDTGLSNYFQRFPLHFDYSFDLRNIGHFYGQYARLMTHWLKVLPSKMLEISYEDMIMNTEPTVRHMLDFLGLEWADRCLAPHTNPCLVETASNWQVRQPIYQRSLERWRHYEKHLTPMTDELRSAGIVWGEPQTQQHITKL